MKSWQVLSLQRATIKCISVGGMEVCPNFVPSIDGHCGPIWGARKVRAEIVQAQAANAFARSAYLAVTSAEVIPELLR